MACDYSLEDGSLGRPTLGVINLCPGAVGAAGAAVQQAGSGPVGGNIIDVLVHEIIHALGLSATMFSSWLGPGPNSTSLEEYAGDSGPSPSGYPDGGTRLQGNTSYLVTPAVTKTAQQLLNCTRVREGTHPELLGVISLLNFFLNFLSLLMHDLHAPPCSSWEPLWRTRVA